MITTNCQRSCKEAVVAYVNMNLTYLAYGLAVIGAVEVRRTRFVFCMVSHSLVLLIGVFGDFLCRVAS